ncbi:hypothetical protein GCM10010919_19260 [Alishewanella longhuensis]|uniref:Formyl transferase N-terminal domain-containing protein n=1 Tax=Alishewanella longhuensis TaxID=1091037 RepID=A0ABQ3KZ79_9ALTE|nr:hypothetical protein [Alishewanella longhuensis]GHG69368.1 hypothetical protein GCM10010919_19260 [Alishewanella longhuensis]
MINNDRPGFIYFPGCRASAYLDMMQQCQLPPRCIIMLQNPLAQQGLNAAAAHPLIDQFYNPNIDVAAYCKQHQIPLIYCNATSINAAELATVLLAQPTRCWLFSGGGIVKKTLLDHDLEFIHVHPGQLPEVRGSTCFYYSLLHDHSLAATAFMLAQELDSGPVLYGQHFTINVPPPLISSDFIDYVVDPFIRAQTLKPLWQQWPSEVLTLSRQTFSKAPSDRPCFVMHPVLRALAMKRTANTYVPTKPTGVFCHD